jgi:hypothetical protein
MSACAGTSVTTDHRGDPKRPIWETVITYALVSGDTTATIAQPIEGTLQKIILAASDNTGNRTSTLTITDRADKTIFTSAAGLAENATHVWNLSEPLSGPCDVLVTYSGDVGGTHTDYVYLRGV